MHMQSLVMWICLAIGIGIPFFLFQRRRAMERGLRAFLAARKFSTRAASPIAALADKNPPDGFHFSAAYDGVVDGAPMSLLMLRRTETFVSQGITRQNQTIYVGVYVASADPANVAHWQRKAQARQDQVVHVSQPGEGGLLVVWKGAPSRANVEAHLAAIAGSMRQTRA